MAALCAVKFCVSSASATDNIPHLPPSVTAFLDNKATDQQTNATLKSIQENVLPTLKKFIDSEVLFHALTQDNNTRMVLTTMEIEKLQNHWSRAIAVRDYDTLDPILKTSASKTLRQLKSQAGFKGARLYLTDNRGLLTAAAQAYGDYTHGNPEAWRRIYLSSKGAAFIEKSNTSYRIEIGIWNPALREAVGTLIAEIPDPDMKIEPISSASVESSDHLNLR